MINIVYHCYLVNNWKEIVSEQLERIKLSGLYDKVDNFFVTVNLGQSNKDEFTNFVSQYSKLKIEFNENNSAEYPGIRKVREIALNDDCKIFYLHTKGVSNRYVRIGKPEESTEKIKNIKAWRECLEYFLIDKWEDCVSKLDEFDNVGVTCSGGWYWGNFWWSKSEQIKKTPEVGIWGRWDYESWLNKNTPNAKNFEYYKMTYNPYITEIQKSWYDGNPLYKGSDIKIISAKYGTLDFEIDEGYTNLKLNVVNDVLDLVNENLKSNNYKKISLRADNETLGGDPIWGHKKFLTVEISPEEDTNKVFKIGVHEGLTLTFEF